MKTFEVWMEGYAATGQRSDAQKIADAEGETFEEAVRNYRHPEDVVSKYTGQIIIVKGTPLGLDLKEDGSFTYERPSIWGCRLFDNEQDARKSFG